MSSWHATLAQLVEHLTCNEDVVGSIPTGGSILVRVKAFHKHVVLERFITILYPSLRWLLFWLDEYKIIVFILHTRVKCIKMV